MASNYRTNIQNAVDGYRNPLGFTIDTQGNTVAYKTYEGTLTATTTFDVNTDLGRYGSGGVVVNDSTTDTVQLSFSTDGGTTFGDTFTLIRGDIFSMDFGFVFTHIRLTHTNDIDYRILVR